MAEEPHDNELHEAAAAEIGNPRAPVDLPRALRPREKLFSKGPAILSNGELLALVLGAGAGREPAGRTADRLMRRHGLKGLAALSAGAWRSERSIGVASAARLCAAFELGRRANRENGGSGRPRINGPRQAFKLVRRLCTAKKEHLVGLYLDAQNGLLSQETVSIGSLNTTRTHPREILFPAVANLALGFILVHNHPSGCLEPSQEDVEFTQVVRRAGEMMGIELYDHLIVAASGFSSFRERGLL
jgi:DNA repair protein RadC